MPYERSNCLKHLIPLTIQLRRVLRIISKDEFDNQYEKKFDPHSFGTFSTLVMLPHTLKIVCFLVHFLLDQITLLYIILSKWFMQVLISTFDSLPYMEERIEELTEK